MIHFTGSFPIKFPGQDCNLIESMLETCPSQETPECITPNETLNYCFSMDLTNKI